MRNVMTCLPSDILNHIKTFAPKEKANENLSETKRRALLRRQTKQRKFFVNRMILQYFRYCSKNNVRGLPRADVKKLVTAQLV